MPLALAVLTLGGALFLVIGWMSLVGSLPPNSFVGIRTHYTRESPENWFATHRAAAPVLIWVGVAVVAAGLAFLPFAVVGVLGDGFILGLVIGLGMLLVVGAIASWMYGTRSARLRPG
ncbi:MAG: SdpI family protein [Tepidiformaceae bacterium]